MSLSSRYLTSSASPPRFLNPISSSSSSSSSFSSCAAELSAGVLLAEVSLIEGTPALEDEEEVDGGWELTVSVDRAKLWNRNKKGLKRMFSLK